jgi:hypothetical protein
MKTMAMLRGWLIKTNVRSHGANKFITFAPSLLMEVYGRSNTAQLTSWSLSRDILFQQLELMAVAN